jgi:hypothetical protein
MVQTQSKPAWYTGTREDWNTMSVGEREAAKSIYTRSKSKIGPNPVAVSNSSVPKTIINNSPSATKPMLDIRDWDEDVDGINGERLRNCIIFQLDFKKDDWYKYRLTPAYVRAKAKKLDDDTPPGWTPPDPDPLIAIRACNFDGELLEIREITRRPKNLEERERLISMLMDRHGRANPNIVKWLVDPQCAKCRGLGSYLVKIYPNDKKLRWQETWCNCECVTAKEFKAPSTK